MCFSACLFSVVHACLIVGLSLFVVLVMLLCSTIFSYHRTSPLIGIPFYCAFCPCRYEVGGAIVHPANLLMAQFLDICQFKKKEGKGDEGGGNGPFSLHRYGSTSRWTR